MKSKLKFRLFKYNSKEYYYDLTQIANIFGFAGLIEKNYWIPYDFDSEDAFTVHSRNGDKVKFERTPEGLYDSIPSDEYLAEVAEAQQMEPPKEEKNLKFKNMVTTVKEKTQGYSRQQIKVAKRQRDSITYFSILQWKFLSTLLGRKQIIRNCPVIIAVINNAEQIYGPDIAAMKEKNWKTGHQKSEAVDEENASDNEKESVASLRPSRNVLT